MLGSGGVGVGDPSFDGRRRHREDEVAKTIVIEFGKACRDEVDLRWGHATSNAPFDDAYSLLGSTAIETAIETVIETAIETAVFAELHEVFDDDRFDVHLVHGGHHRAVALLHEGCNNSDVPLGPTSVSFAQGAARVKWSFTGLVEVRR